MSCSTMPGRHGASTSFPLLLLLLLLLLGAPSTSQRLQLPCTSHQASLSLCGTLYSAMPDLTQLAAAMYHPHRKILCFPETSPCAACQHIICSGLCLPNKGLLQQRAVSGLL